MGPQMDCLFLMENAIDMDDLGVLSFQEKRHDVENSPLKNAHEETEKAPSIRFSLAGPHFYWTQPIHC